MQMQPLKEQPGGGLVSVCGFQVSKCNWRVALAVQFTLHGFGLNHSLGGLTFNPMLDKSFSNAPTLSRLRRLLF
jgi:hypothetical protein